MPRQTHFDGVRALVSRHSGVPEAEITPETRLLEDLGMDGDDGADFLAAFAHEFRIDPATIAARNYFGDEGSLAGRSSLIPLAARLSPAFRARARDAARGLRTLRVRDLVASARAGRWIRPPLSPAGADPTRFTARALTVLASAVLAPLAIGLWQYARLGVPAPRAGQTGLGVFAVLCGLLIVRFLLSLRWLRRLDEAAALEERALSEAD